MQNMAGADVALAMALITNETSTTSSSHDRYKSDALAATRVVHTLATAARADKGSLEKHTYFCSSFCSRQRRLRDEYMPAKAAPRALQARYHRYLQRQHCRAAMRRFKSNPHAGCRLGHQGIEGRSHPNVSEASVQPILISGCMKAKHNSCPILTRTLYVAMAKRYSR